MSKFHIRNSHSEKIIKTSISLVVYPHNNFPNNYDRYLTFADSYSKNKSNKFTEKTYTCYLKKLYEKLLKQGQQNGLLDENLTKTIELQELIMEQKIKQHSKFVIKDSFDFGIRNFYSKIANAVNNSLKKKGIQLLENEQLLKQKQNSLKRKSSILKSRFKSAPKQFQNMSTKKSSIIRFPTITNDSRLEDTISSSPIKNMQYKKMNVDYKKRIRKQYKRIKFEKNRTEYFFQQR